MSPRPFLNYTQIVDDLKAAVDLADLGFATTFANAGDRDFSFQNAPLLDIRVKQGNPTPITNQSYYTELVLEAEIMAYSMTSRREAAIMRDELTNLLQGFVRDNPRFSGYVDTTYVGQVNFGTGESKNDGAFVAGAVLEFRVQFETV
jgi:hypothetical protein